MPFPAWEIRKKTSQNPCASGALASSPMKNSKKWVCAARCPAVSISIPRNTLTARSCASWAIPPHMLISRCSRLSKTPGSRTATYRMLEPALLPHRAARRAPTLLRVPISFEHAASARSGRTWCRARWEVRFPPVWPPLSRSRASITH